MTEELKPYRPPETEGLQQKTDASSDPITAPLGRRFGNFVIDTLGHYGFTYVVVYVSAMLMVYSGGDVERFVTMLESPAGYLFGMLTYVAYFWIQEGLFSRTLGKLLTGTVVVDEHGNRPSQMKVLGRTLARFIPFEPFSFFGETQRGWHDSLSKTYVVLRRKKSEPAV